MEEQLEQYLMDASEPRKEWMSQLEKIATKENVPIMDPLGMDFVRQLIRLKNPKKILEIGTAIGYSSLMMADAWPEAEIVTIERDPERYKQAVKNMERLDKKNQIEVILGDALEAAEVAADQGPYDLIFIDAAKGQYKRFFEIYTAFLKEEGIVITDNVLFKGLVSGENRTASKRLSNIAAKVRDFNDWLIGQEDYHTTIIPIGDGIAVSVRKQPRGKRG